MNDQWYYERLKKSMCFSKMNSPKKESENNNTKLKRVQLISMFYNERPSITSESKSLLLSIFIVHQLRNLQSIINDKSLQLDLIENQAK